MSIVLSIAGKGQPYNAKSQDFIDFLGASFDIYLAAVAINGLSFSFLPVEGKKRITCVLDFYKGQNALHTFSKGA